MEEEDPLGDGPVGSDDGGDPAVPLDDDLVGVPGLLGIEPAESEVVDDDQVRGEEAPPHPLGGVVGPGLMDEPAQGVVSQKQDDAEVPTSASLSPSAPSHSRLNRRMAGNSTGTCPEGS